MLKILFICGFYLFSVQKTRAIVTDTIAVDTFPGKNNIISLELNPVFMWIQNRKNSYFKPLAFELSYKRNMNSRTGWKFSLYYRSTFTDRLEYLDGKYIPADTVPAYDNFYFSGKGYKKCYDRSIRVSSGPEFFLFKESKLVLMAVMLFYENNMFRKRSELEKNYVFNYYSVAREITTFRMDVFQKWLGVRLGFTGNVNFSDLWGAHIIMNFYPAVVNTVVEERRADDTNLVKGSNTTVFTVGFNLSAGIHYCW